MIAITAKLLVSGLFIILLASLAFAAIEVTEGSVILEVDYRDFMLNDQDFVTESGQFTITNNGADETVQLLIHDLPNKYNATPLTNLLVPAGSSRTVQFSLQVPHAQDSGDKGIGFITVQNSNGVELDRVFLTQRTLKMLEIAELKVDYVSEGESQERDTFDDENDDFQLHEGVKAGREVLLLFDIKNLFDNDYEEDFSVMEQITLTITADDNNVFQEELTDEFDLGEINAGQRGEYRIPFTINDDAEGKEYKLLIEIEGEDGKGANHRIKKDLILKVERETNDVRVNKAEVLPLTITACDSLFNLNLQIKNFGTKEQLYTAVTIYNSNLGITEQRKDIVLEKFSKRENTWSQKLVFPIPIGTAPGTYSLVITTYVRNDQKMDTETINVVLQPCGQQMTNVQENKTAPEVKIIEENVKPALAKKETKTEQSDNSKISSSAVFRVTEDPYTKDDLIVGLFILGMIIVLAVTVMFGFILFKE